MLDIVSPVEPLMMDSRLSARTDPPIELLKSHTHLRMFAHSDC